MARSPRFAVGDKIVLKDGFVRTDSAGRTCTISGVLPFDGSRAQYRVRFETENFDRRIIESDIDVTQSASSVPNNETVTSVETGSWLKSSSIRVRK
ncbi:cold-shock protein [Rhizobium sp. Root1220]|nr:cold-shock protein [Rhizobium sp. Root1220]